MKYALFVVMIFLIALCWAMSVPSAMNAEYENQEQNIPAGFGSIIEPKFEEPSLYGFSEASKQGKRWDCNFSAHPVNGEIKQIITACFSGLCVCQDGIPLFKDCPNGQRIASLGHHDSCKE